VRAAHEVAEPHGGRRGLQLKFAVDVTPQVHAVRYQRDVGPGTRMFISKSGKIS
jgi:hypothetical protein